MGLFTGESSVTVSIITIGLLGVVECFFGYRVFRILLVILGFFLGAFLASMLIKSDQLAVQIIVGLVGGLLGAALFHFLYVVATVLAGLILGGTAAALLVANSNFGSTMNIVIIIVGAVLGGILALALAKYIIMLSTAFTGAAQIVYAVLLLLLGVQHGQQASPLAVSPPNSLIATVAILVLAAVGFIVQFATNQPPVQRDIPAPTP